jgi:hypothetical protein
VTSPNGNGGVSARLLGISLALVAGMSGVAYKLLLDRIDGLDVSHKAETALRWSVYSEAHRELDTKLQLEIELRSQVSALKAVVEARDLEIRMLRARP